MGPLEREVGGDGDYLCGLVKDSAGSYSLSVTDFKGHSRGFALTDPGTYPGVIECSKNANQAVVSNQSEITVRSLSDGHVETTIAGAYSAPLPVSPDLQWLAFNSQSEPGGVWGTTVVSLADGTVHARLPGVVAAAFLPDGKHLVVSDGAASRTRMVDWRTGHELWSGPGGPAPIAISDLLTDKMVVDLVIGSAEHGTDRHDYWIVDGTGAASEFIPQERASPAR
jgi:hypothetical protein